MEMKVGIIGCGGIAGSHISGYKENQIEVTAIADIALDAEKRAKELVPDAKFFNDAGSLLKSGLVNAVSICTPPLGHEATALEAIKNNIHVLCEKPLGFDIEASRKIHEAAANSNVQFMTAFRHRFIPGVKKLKELIDQGAIGQPIWFRNTFCSPAFDMVDKWYSKKEIAGGGTLMDTSIHSVDIFRYLFGEVSDQHLVAHQHLQATDVEDVSIISLKSAEGVLGTCYASWVSGTKIFEIDIMGQDGRLRFEYTDQVKLLKRGEDSWQEFTVEKDGGFAAQIAHFAEAVKGKVPLEITAYDGLRAVEIILSNEESNELQLAVN